MLVLSRKKGEKILMSNDTQVTVIEIRGDKVRLGIEAPNTTRVLRQELLPKLSPDQQAQFTLRPEAPVLPA